MKLGPVTEIDKRNKAMPKKLTMMSCQKIVMTLPFFNLWPIWSKPEARFRTQSL